MNVNSPRLSKRKLFLVLFFISLLAYLFWTGSRYPALNEKALMGGDMSISGIGFDIAYEVLPDDSLIVKIGKTTLNWIKTNKKGMTFGILFASLFLILFSWLNKLEFKNKFVQSFFGLFIGAPLGVCVNCAAPIAFGARKANLSVISSLSMMMSSPTFNFVILTMLFTMFHPYVALLKIISAALLILIGVPIIAKFGGKNAVIEDTGKNTQLSFLSEDERIYKEEGFLKTCQWFIIQFVKSLFFILKKTLPLMLLAGLLGSVFISLMDWEGLFGMSTLMNNESVKMIVLLLAFFAVVGTFLPVPIAFDVIVVAILLNLGISYAIASTLLFTLGIFSIYSFLIVRKAINLKTALLLFCAITFVGFLNGLVGLYFDKHLVPTDKEMIAWLKEYKGELYKVEGKINSEKAYSFDPIAKVPTTLKTSNADIFESKFEVKSANGFTFTLHAGPDIGINRSYEFTPYDELHAGFNIVNGFSSSGVDYNDDGWVDLVFGSPYGLQRFKNQGGKGFIKEPFGVDLLDSNHVILGQIIDLNNDGFKDVVASVLTEGLYIFYGSETGYQESNSTKIDFPNKYISSRALSFHDIDEDGDLDIFCGNWSMGKGEGNISYKSSTDYFIINHIDSLELVKTKYPQGATLTSMFWDQDGNSRKEFFVGIDFEQPDWSTQDFSLDKPFDNNLPYTTMTTMSVAAADINNDLKQDLYIAQIAEKSLHGNEMIKDVDQICDCFNNTPYADECKKIVLARQNTRLALFTGNFKFLSGTLKASAYKIFLLMEIDRRKSQAKSISEDLEAYSSDLSLWNLVYDSANIYKEYNMKNMVSSEYLRQKMDLNLLFMNKDGELVDKTQAYNLNKGGWSWNAQFEDLNNDEFVDLFIVNGSGRLASNQSSFFYLNKSGQKFEEVGERVGLRNYLSSQSYTYIDYDNDGDMDIAVLPEGGPVLLFENNLNGANSIQFELNSEHNMSAVVGAKVYIYYGENNALHQMREIRQSGGYQSYNPTSVHFGLSQYQQINKAVVVWNNGDSTVVNEPLKAGYKYWIDKKSK